MTRSRLVLSLLLTFTIGVVVAPAASWAAAYFSTTQTVSGTGSVSCPYGTRLTGGGAELQYSNYFSSYSSVEYSLRGSRPSYNGWTASATKVSGSFSSLSGWRFTTSLFSPRVYAVCAR